MTRDDMPQGLAHLGILCCRDPSIGCGEQLIIIAYCMLSCVFFQAGDISCTYGALHKYSPPVNFPFFYFVLWPLTLYHFINTKCTMLWWWKIHYCETISRTTKQSSPRCISIHPHPESILCRNSFRCNYCCKTFLCLFRPALHIKRRNAFANSSLQNSPSLGRLDGELGWICEQQFSGQILSWSYWTVLTHLYSLISTTPL